MRAIHALCLVTAVFGAGQAQGVKPLAKGPGLMGETGPGSPYGQVRHAVRAAVADPVGKAKAELVKRKAPPKLMDKVHEIALSAERGTVSGPWNNVKVTTSYGGQPLVETLKIANTGATYEVVSPLSGQYGRAQRGKVVTVWTQDRSGSWTVNEKSFFSRKAKGNDWTQISSGK